MNRRYRHLSRKYLSIMLCFVMIFVFTLTIAYAALSITLNITGTAEVNAVNWDIHLENAVVNSNSSVTNVPVVNGSTASFSVELNKPGDFYEFTVDVVNAGGIDAVISSITKSGLTTEQERYLNYTITYQNGESVTNNQLISANTSQRLLVRLEYRRDLVASDLPSTTQTLNLSFAVSYVQSDGSGISVPGNGKGLISFSIAGKSYQAEEGMTFGEWVNSSYNIDSCFFNGDHLYNNCNPIPGVSPSTVIINNSSYRVSCCFDAGSQILMADGTTKNIEDVQVGDMVMSLNEDTGEFTSQRVSGTIINEYSTDLVYVHLSNGVRIGMRAYHPLLTTEGYKSLRPEEALQDGVEASLLEIGDTLIGYGENVTVIDIEEREHIPNYKTYNLSIEGYHNYVVEGVVAHNAVGCPCPPGWNG